MRIATRTHCLGGSAIYFKIGDKHEFYNQQKVRVDMFMDIINGKLKKPNSNAIVSILQSPEIVSGVYKQSEDLLWLQMQKPDYLIMDNYTELTNKLFIHKTEHWAICGEYGHFKEGTLTEDKFMHCGLLPINDIYIKYDEFFDYIAKWWNIPIIFMHFPTTFDDREMYKEQGNAITSAIDKLSKKYNIQDIHSDENLIESHGDGDVYHFSDNTKKHIAAKMQINGY